MPNRQLCYKHNCFAYGKNYQKTWVFRETKEEQARANLQREIDKLLT